MRSGKNVIVFELDKNMHQSSSREIDHAERKERSIVLYAPLFGSLTVWARLRERAATLSQVPPSPPLLHTDTHIHTFIHTYLLFCPLPPHLFPDEPTLLPSSFPLFFFFFFFPFFHLRRSKVNVVGRRRPGSGCAIVAPNCSARRVLYAVIYRDSASAFFSTL